MQNNTLKDYKKAIRRKYEIEKEGQYFDYLYSPSRGKLRDFCWMIFEGNPTQDDLNVFKNLFSLDFDHTKKKKFKEQKDKFRPIETFFKGETDPTNIDAINLAAIMVDFEPRPFKKFNKQFRTEAAKQTESTDKAKAVFAIEKQIIQIASFVENQKSGEYPKQGNLFVNLINQFKERLENSFWKERVLQFKN